MIQKERVSENNAGNRVKWKCRTCVADSKYLRGEGEEEEKEDIIKMFNL